MPERHRLVFLRDLAGKTKITPGTTYVEWDNKLRQRIELTSRPRYKVRLIITAQGNETGENKGIQLYNVTDGVAVVDYTWDGTALQVTRRSDFALLNVSADITFAVYVKGSSGTENITAYVIEAEFIEELA